MNLHNKGAKADRDRTLLIESYAVMTKTFKTPVKKILTVEQIAKMTNAQLYQTAKDLYNSQSFKNSMKLAVKLGRAEKPEPWIIRAFKSLRIRDLHPEKNELHSKTRYAEVQNG